MDALPAAGAGNPAHDIVTNKLITTRIGTAMLVASLAPWLVSSGSAQQFDSGHTRYASPTSVVTSGPCIQAAPCQLGHAIAGAASGDQVIVEPGDYHVASTLRATVPIQLSGEAGHPFPHVIGDATLNSQTLQLAGGTVSRLYVEATAPEGVALDLQSGTADQVIAVAVGGDHEAGAVNLEGSPGTTVLRNSLARVVGDEGEVLAVDHGTGADRTAIVNVTAVGGSRTTGLEVKVTSATVRNSIIRGGTHDLDQISGTLTVDHSNFSRTTSTAFTDAGGNQVTAPAFVDPVNGDFHQQPASATVDAGASDPSIGSVDLDGLPRASGSAPDIGAYEHQVTKPAQPPVPAPPASDPFSQFAAGPGGSKGNQLGFPLPASRPLPPLSAGRSIAARSLAGKATVRLPGTHTWVPLSDVASLPVGSVIDSRTAVIQLFTAADLQGTVQDAFLYGSKFRVRQTRSAAPITKLIPTGGDFGSCASASAPTSSVTPITPAAFVASAHRRSTGARKHIVRSLWARDNHGSFRTHGINSVATVRGTAWRVDERCDGTYTKVLQGEVGVKDRNTGRTHLVTAHHHYMAYAR